MQPRCTGLVPAAGGGTVSWWKTRPPHGRPHRLWTGLQRVSTVCVPSSQEPSHT